MPEMGGFEATTKIRELEDKRSTSSRIPIIAMTAHAIRGYKEKCLEGGMDGYISKPIQINLLKQTIDEFLVKRSKMAQEENSKNILDIEVQQNHVNIAL